MQPPMGNERPAGPGRPVTAFVLATAAPPLPGASSPFAAGGPFVRPEVGPPPRPGVPPPQANAPPPFGAPPPAAIGGYRGPTLPRPGVLPPQASAPPPFVAPPAAVTGGCRGPTPPQGPFGTALRSQGPFPSGAPPQSPFTSALLSQGPFTSAPPSQGPFTSAPPSQGPFASAPPSKTPLAAPPQGPFAAGPPPQGPFASAPVPFRPPPSSLLQPQSPAGGAAPPPPSYVRPPPPVQSQPPPMQGYYPGAPPANPQFPMPRQGFQQPVQTMPPPTMGPPVAFGNQAAYPTAGPPDGGTLQSLVEDFQSLSLSSVPGSLDPGLDVKGLPRPLDGDELPVKVLEAYPLNCHLRYFRLTTHVIPASQSLFTRWHLPMGAVVHPLAESPDGVMNYKIVQLFISSELAISLTSLFSVHRRKCQSSTLELLVSSVVEDAGRI
jgi:protein transport protein SEC24